MKFRTVVLLLSVVLAGAAVCFAADASVGTWKLDEAKSKLNPNAAKNSTVTIEAAGGDMKVTVDGVGPGGAPSHNEWTGKYDGKQYPISGDPAADTRSYRKINDHTYALEQMKNGKVVTTGRVTYSADGKTRTVTATGTNDKGQKITTTSVYNKS